MRVLRYNSPGLPVILRASCVGAALALVILAASSCGRLKITGNPPPNQKPELILVNTPPGGMLVGANPTVYWYGTDSDGRVVRYDYAVVPETGAGFSIESFLKRHNNDCSSAATDIERFIRCARDSMPWVSIFVDSSIGSLPTRQRIPLYASFDTLECDSETVTENIYDDSGKVIDVRFVAYPINCVSMSIGQYMFIRAIDDQGAESDMKYRSFLRNNHWPETFVSNFDMFSNYFSVPNLTETYKGIRINWYGTDRLDFLPGQAKLDFHWRVYGPFPVGDGTMKDRPTIGDTILFKTPILESRNPDPRKGVWVADTTTVLYDLWRQVDSISTPPDTTRSAFFLFLVQSRDDASVSDPSPDSATFQAVYAKFERKLLLVDETAYTISPGGYPSWDPYRREDVAAQSRDTNEAFLFRMARLIDANIEDKGGVPHKAWDPALDYFQRVGQLKLCSVDRCARAVPLTELSKHEMVLYIDDDIVEPVTMNPDMTLPLRQYLDVGGKLWLVSRVGFLYGTEIGSSASPNLIDFEIDKRVFPVRYFGIAGMYFAGFYSGVKGGGDKPATSNDEFIAADRVISTDPNLATPNNLAGTLDVDSVRLAVHWLQLRKFITTDVIRGVPAVGYVIRETDDQFPRTRPLYLFRSWRPGFSSADKRLMAVRAVGPTMRTPKFKTAFMGCPLWFFKENQDQMDKYVIGMTDWFYNHPIEEGP